MDKETTAQNEETTSTETPETPASPAENGETSSSSEGDAESVPQDLDPNKSLHQDARFRRVIESKNRYKQERDDALAELAQLRAEPSKKSENSRNDSSIPSWFTAYFGTEDQAKEAWNHLKPVDRNELKQEIMREIQEERSAAEKEAQRWSNWVEESLEALEDEGETFERNALLKVMTEFTPTDAEGNLDFKKGLELLRLKQPQKDMTERKKVADTVSGKTSAGGEPKNKDYVTSSMIQQWRRQGII